MAKYDPFGSLIDHAFIGSKDGTWPSLPPVLLQPIRRSRVAGFRDFCLGVSALVATSAYAFSVAAPAVAIGAVVNQAPVLIEGLGKLFQ